MCQGEFTLTMAVVRRLQKAEFSASALVQREEPLKNICRMVQRRKQRYLNLYSFVRMKKTEEM